MPAEIVDGNDVFAVYDATERALAHCRAGLGPYLLECKTFRMTGHSAHDAAHYVPKELFEEWGKLDPIVRLENDDARERLGRPRRHRRDPRRYPARKSTRPSPGPSNRPYPDPATLLDGVYEDQ